MGLRAAALGMLLGALAGCGGMNVQPAEPARGRGDADMPRENPNAPDAKPWFGPSVRLPEETITLPSPPQDADLQRFELRADANATAAIDRRSLSVGKDAIVRYTLVVTPDGGVRNVTYEAMRCGPAEFKIYATGGSHGAWTSASQPTWRPVESKFYNAVRYTLAKDYLCELDGGPTASPERIIRKIRDSRFRLDNRTTN